MPIPASRAHPDFPGRRLPPEFEELNLMELSGLIMVAGGPDSGKTTLVQYLVDRLLAVQGSAACLDADPGQSRLGPPATFTLECILNAGGHAEKKSRWQRFVGSVTPAGHMLQVLSGCGRLVQKARETGVGVIVMDTSGLVDPQKGGARLKLAKIDLLEPSVLIVLQQADELASWVRPLKRARRTRVLTMTCPPVLRRRDFPERRAYREAAFRRYFRDAGLRTFYWPDYGVFPDLCFFRNRLVAFEDRQGFVLGLGIVREYDRFAKTVSAWTCLTDTQKRRVAAISLGDVVLDPSNFSHSITHPAPEKNRITC